VLPVRETWWRGWTAYRMELRLLCLHWGFPVLHLLWALLIGWSAREVLTLSAHDVLANDLGGLALGLMGLGGVFVAGASATRGHRTRFAPLEETFPAGAEVFVGRWLADVTALMTAVAVPLALAAAHGPAGSFWAGAPAFLAEAVVAVAFSTALTWWLLDGQGPRRWLYPAAVILWLGCGAAGRVLAGSVLHLNFAGLLDVMHLMYTHFDEIWGHIRDWPLRLWFDLFYAGAALALVAAGVWRRQRRGGRSPLVTGVLFLASLGLALGAAVQYVATVSAWNRQGLAIRAATDRAIGVADPDAGATAVDRYRLAVDLTDPARLQVDATITLRNQGSTPLSAPVFTLVQDLKIVEASVPLERDGHLLRLRLPEPIMPGESREVRLRYAGRIWAVKESAVPYPAYFTHADGVYLSTLAGWYPMAGRVGLSPWAGYQVHPPAAFDVTVTGPPGWTFASNLPAERPGHFVSGAA
jgi:hypothetical protein